MEPMLFFSGIDFTTENRTVRIRTSIFLFLLLSISLHSGFAEIPLSTFLSKRSLTITLIGGTAAFLASEVDDDDLMFRTFDGEGPVMENGIDLGNAYANGASLAIRTLGLLLAGHLGGSPALTDAGNDLTRSLLLSGAMVWALKLGIDRQRPGGGRYSFPSGHTAAAFSVAPVLHYHFGWKAGIPAYALAAFAGLGRMEDRRHYLSDVLFGATIGYAVGKAVIDRDAPVKYLDHLSLGPRGASLSTGF